MYNMKPVLILTSFAFLLTFGATVLAQDAPGPGYVQGTLGVAIQPKANPNHRIRPPLDGAGFPAVAVAGGYFIRPSLALEGELAAVEASREQAFIYSWSEEYTAAVNVLAFNASLRWKPRGTSPVEFVAGGGVARVRHETRDRILIEYRYPPSGGTERTFRSCRTRLPPAT